MTTMQSKIQDIVNTNFFTESQKVVFNLIKDGGYTTTGEIYEDYYNAVRTSADWSKCSTKYKKSCARVINSLQRKLEKFEPETIIFLGSVKNVNQYGESDGVLVDIYMDALERAINNIHESLFPAPANEASAPAKALSEDQCKAMTAEELFYSAIFSLKTLSAILKQKGYETEARKVTAAMYTAEDAWENDLRDDVWLRNLGEAMIEVPTPAPTPTPTPAHEAPANEAPAHDTSAPAHEAPTQHFAIVQRSSDTVLVVGESAEDAVREYCVECEEATKAELTGSWHSDQDTVLVPCTEFLYEKALAGDDIVYFWDEDVLTCYITEVEDFDRADTTLSSEYDNSSDHPTFDSHSHPVFNFREYLLEVAQDYDTLLDCDDVSDITNDIAAHFSDDYSRDYDTVVFASCTNSNQYPDGQFKLDGEDRYCLSFDRSDAVLILRKG